MPSGTNGRRRCKKMVSFEFKQCLSIHKSTWKKAGQLNANNALHLQVWINVLMD